MSHWGRANDPGNYDGRDIKSFWGQSQADSVRPPRTGLGLHLDKPANSSMSAVLRPPTESAVRLGSPTSNERSVWQS